MKKDDIIFLKNLQHELNNQPTDGNADPIFWGITEEQEVSAYPGCGDNYIIRYNGDIYREKDITKLKAILIKDNAFYDEDGVFYDEDGDISTLVGIYDNVDIECNEIEIFEYTNEQVLSHNTGAFLTKKACQDYIDKFGYNHRKPHTYAMTAFRNFELKRLLEILKTIDLSIESPDDKINLLSENEKEHIYRQQLNDYQLLDARIHYENYCSFYEDHCNYYGNNIDKSLFKLDEKTCQDLVDMFNAKRDCNVAENDTWKNTIEDYFNDLK